MAEQNSTARQDTKRRRATGHNKGAAAQVKANLICYDFTRQRRDDVQKAIDQAAALTDEEHEFDGCLIVLFGKGRTICRSAGTLKDPAMATYHAMKVIRHLVD